MKRQGFILGICLIVCMLLICFVGCEETKTMPAEKKITMRVPNDDEVVVHFIDVGQADCTLIMAGEEAMLVDAGNNADGDFVVRYLKKQGIKKLDYLIGTHPHEDHIGGIDTVIRNFEIGTTIVPVKESTTNTFQNMLEAMAEKGYKFTKPVVGETYALGHASFRILAPVRDYEDNLNNWSVGLLITDGSHSMVLCGDAEEEAEEDMLAQSGDFRADILKVNHHGSSSSSCAPFLQAVNPSYAVIHVGEKNEYGHPHTETMRALKARGTTIYRTDRHGSIICVWNEDIAWATEKNIEPKKETYILNTKSKVYHLPSCESVGEMSSKNKKSMTATVDDLQAQGYKPCGGCRP
ncbi:MAG: MBL fold metallo-hydrolase [Clostridia bacterium]|nr:MBL fold metallo-hydrolase [Clostridia bacterium]